jgi:micrococcal nuclease
MYLNIAKYVQPTILFVLLALISTGCQTVVKATPAMELPELIAESSTQEHPETNIAKAPVIFSTSNPSMPECLLGQNMEEARVIRVIDGDTIEVLLNGKVEKVRYLMVDSPEMNASNPLPGRAAKDFNDHLVDGKNVILISDTTNRDEFGRLLRFIIVNGKFVNYELVRQGYATTFILAGDTLCSQEFQNAMFEAFETRAGIWQNIKEIENKTGNSCPDGCMDHLAGCDIKGNISSQGGKIYHLPGDEDYNNVVISTKKGERWFCTLEEVIANGWRPPREN